MFNSSLGKGLVLWVLVVLVNFFRTGDLKYKFSFSVRNYYLLMLAFLVDPAYQALKIRSWYPVILFLVFALAGVLGETLFSMWWHVFFKKKFWTYRVETLVHGYSSLLNFIPWGVGGMLFYDIAQRPVMALPGGNVASGGGNASLPFWVIFALGVLLGLLVQAAIWLSFYLRRKPDFKFYEVNLGNYLFFCLPYMLGLGFCAAIYGKGFILMAAAFAAMAALAEYLFGKAVEFFISKKLWVYNYEAVDGGHFTPLVFVPFSLAGFYFWAIALIINQFR